MEENNEWGAEKLSPKERILDFLRPCMIPFENVRHWVRFRFHPKYRYHVVKTGLVPGYYDEDVLILHTCMMLLERYIAWHDGEHKFEEFTKELKEKPEVWGCGADEMSPHVITQTEALAIYRWWKYEHPLDEKRMEELWDLIPSDLRIARREVYKDIDDLGRKMHDDEQKMLHRLIDIRGSLWE